MALGRQLEQQADMLMSWSEMPRSPGHAFFDKLQTVMIDPDRTLDRFAAALGRGRPELIMGSCLAPMTAFQLHGAAPPQQTCSVATDRITKVLPAT
jgi:hypothetical protein